MAWRLELPNHSYHPAVAVWWRHCNHQIVIKVLTPYCKTQFVVGLFRTIITDIRGSILDVVYPWHLSLALERQEPWFHS